eukprot:Skav214791  [mRNA]  locus=scaffold3850:48759:50988:+ [translate_table: standard]
MATTGIPFEVKDAATKALKKGSQPLPSHASRRDAEALTALLDRARSCDGDEGLIAKAERQLQSWGLIPQATTWRALYLPSLEATGASWTEKALRELFVRLDTKRDRRLDQEEFVSRLLESDTESHRLVKEIVLTSPNEEDGLVGLFGPLLLKGTAYKEFPIGTVEALQEANIIGLIFMTSSTVDKQLYPTSLLQLNKTLLKRLAQLYLDLRDPEIENKPTEKLEVVLCSFDTTWDAFTRTVGRPGPPAPWMVMPFDSPWERDYLWRKLHVRFKHPSDPTLVILKPNLEVITVKGFADLDRERESAPFQHVIARPLQSPCGDSRLFHGPCVHHRESADAMHMLAVVQSEQLSDRWLSFMWGAAAPLEVLDKGADGVSTLVREDLWALGEQKPV